jgi:hypothetical protein
MRGFESTLSNPHPLNRLRYIRHPEPDGLKPLIVGDIPPREQGVVLLEHRLSGD